MLQVYDSGQEIGEGKHAGKSKGTWESTLLLDIEEDDFDFHPKVQLLGQTCLDRSLQTSSIPLPKKWSWADSVIAHPLLSNS
jgi:hypothetical protein